MAHGYPEVSRGKRIYTVEIGQRYTSGMFCFLWNLFLKIYQHTTEFPPSVLWYLESEVGEQDKYLELCNMAALVGIPALRLALLLNTSAACCIHELILLYVLGIMGCYANKGNLSSNY